MASVTTDLTDEFPIVSRSFLSVIIVVALCILSVVTIIVASVVIAVGAPVLIVVSVGCYGLLFALAFAAFYSQVPVDSAIVAVANESLGAIVVSGSMVFLP